jgi:hypothetical protein
MAFGVYSDLLHFCAGHRNHFLRLQEKIALVE